MRGLIIERQGRNPAQGRRTHGGLRRGTLPAGAAFVHPGPESHGNFELWVSRDCDREDVCAVLEEYAPEFGPNRCFVLEGPKKGCAANFLSLVFNPEIQADYFAYSDQDDVWERGKLSRAISALVCWRTNRLKNIQTVA